MSFWSFLKRTPPEVTLLIQELEGFRDLYICDSVWDKVVMESAIKEVSKAISGEGTLAKDMIVHDGWSVRETAYLLLSQFNESALRSGYLHVYRGVLSDHGKAHLRLYKTCLGGLLEARRINHKEAIEWLDELENEINAIG